jgi:hypothetical protein
MFGRMPSLLGNLKLDTPVVARQPKVKHLHGYAPLKYCCVAWLPSNRGRVFPLRQPDVIKGRQYTTVS